MNDMQHPHGGGQVLTAGAELPGAGMAVILLHGRGDSAAGIIGLSQSLQPEGHDDVAWLAPQATNNTWYPMSGFLPQEQLSPWLESALMIIDELVDSAINSGVDPTKIVVGGFSQGAMLSLEYASRGRRNIGGVIAFSGSLIGPVDAPHADLANATGIKVCIGCGTNDTWIQADSARTSAALFQEAGADVDLRIYEGMEHRINDDEILAVRAMLGAIAERTTSGSEQA